MRGPAGGSARHITSAREPATRVPAARPSPRPRRTTMRSWRMTRAWQPSRRSRPSQASAPSSRTCWPSWRRRSSGSQAAASSAAVHAQQHASWQNTFGGHDGRINAWQLRSRAGCSLVLSHQLRRTTSTTTTCMLLLRRAHACVHACVQVLHHRGPACRGAQGGAQQAGG